MVHVQVNEYMMAIYFNLLFANSGSDFNYIQFIYRKETVDFPIQHHQ